MTEKDTSTKPGEAALENMKILMKESSVFKVPKIPLRKQKVKKSTVLDEDLYVQGIAKIIQRDFFPDLEKLKAQNDFLEATENKDYARLREITRKYSGSRPPTEPHASPATFDTPSMDRPYSPADPTQVSTQSLQISENRNDKQPNDTTSNYSLDSFLAKHTSEDNASYERVIALEDKKRSTKLIGQFEAECTSAALADAALALPSIEEQADQTNRPHELDTWRYKAKNYIMYVPDGGGSQEAPPKPELQHHNTRLRIDPFDHVKNMETISAIARTQDATVCGKIGVDGVCVGPERGVAGGGAGGGAGRYALVGTPSPRPGAGADRSPLMTWGEIEGTPFRLDGGDTPLPAAGAGAAYRMLEWGARERIGLQLAEQAARRRRPATPAPAPASPGAPGLTPRTPSFRTNTERLAGMSPAARKLAAKHLVSPRLRLTPSNMGILSHAASPKRTHTPQRTPLVATPNAAGKTRPATSGNTNNSGNVTENNNLTDNLLQINLAKRDRLKAQDFFK